ncbi:PREDICTED: solute carrier family 25 member 46-like isoform X3 [Amphimedon queenslandica]|uniref:Uncharacterized protein n=1 Tax=Amphimedon queenslandica TaxID=400682 RepID=A0AAN0J868_AMPQE|nr:PREDICTED: solute carrier family 25 member 46-like isoform X3 [Amphimedon queenslandica]|eukprot:XP_019853220.1 PREDICTED: solute carrier family 25 member 46-like isoform X3 [Amphimedon queenslandica]
MIISRYTVYNYQVLFTHYFVILLFVHVGVDHIIFGAKFLLHSCVTYPFTVFSRQCQAIPYYAVGPLYAAPGMTLYVMNKITSSQGLLSWWRGFKASVICLLGRPFAAAALTWIAERKSRSRKVSVTWSRLRSYLICLVVNGLSYTVCLPLTSFILMESVQNTQQRTYQPDYYGFREFTLERPLLISNDPSKRLSFLQLVVPTVVTSVFCDILREQVLKLVTQFPPLKRVQSSKSHHLSPRSLLKQLWASYISSFVVDMVTYPLRTIVLRLHLQGLPVLVENVETGISVNFVTTFYTGPIDCAQGIWEAEGFTGFYKGFSSVLLQYSLYGLFLVIVWRGIQQWERLKDNNRK